MQNAAEAVPLFTNAGVKIRGLLKIHKFNEIINIIEPRLQNTLVKYWM